MKGKGTKNNFGTIIFKISYFVDNMRVNERKLIFIMSNEIIIMIKIIIFYTLINFGLFCFHKMSSF